MTRCNATNDRKLVDQRLQTYKQVTLEEHPIDSKFDAMPWRREKLMHCMSFEINGKRVLKFNYSKKWTPRCCEQGHTCISILASVSKWKPTCPNQSTDIHWQPSKTSPGYYKIITCKISETCWKFLYQNMGSGQSFEARPIWSLHFDAHRSVIWMLPLSDLIQLHQWNFSSQANIADIANTCMYIY